MKTLKQLWDKEYHEVYSLSLSADEQDDAELDFEPTRKAVRKWLEQKRQEVERRKKNLDNETNEVKIVVWNNLNNILNYIDRELLEELEE